MSFRKFFLKRKVAKSLRNVEKFTQLSTYKDYAREHMVRESGRYGYYSCIRFLAEKKADRLSSHEKAHARRQLRIALRETDDKDDANLVLQLLDRAGESAECVEELLFIRLQAQKLFNWCDLRNFYNWCTVPERLLRAFCSSEEHVIEVRKAGDIVPADLLRPHLLACAERGRLDLVRVLHGPNLSKDLLEMCMKGAEGKSDYGTALECAHELRDCDKIAQYLSIIGTPEQMLIAKLFLEGKVGEEHLS